MRIEARKFGLQTQGIVVTNVNAAAVDRVTAGGRIRTPKVQCIAWEKRYEDEHTDLPTWTLYKSDKEHGLIEGYVIEPQLKEVGLEQHSEYWSEVSQAIEQLPGKLVAVRSGLHGIAWIGQERLESTPDEFIEQMQQGLEKLLKANGELASSRLGE